MSRFFAWGGPPGPRRAPWAGLVEKHQRGYSLTSTLSGVARPDLATAAALVTFFYVLFLHQGYSRLFRDSDAGWHIRSGENILAAGELPRHDPYSFSRAGQPWMNWEWLADVATGAVHRRAGLGGVALLFSGCIAVAVWCWFQLHWKLESNFLIAGALAIPLLGTTNLHWLARPHIYSWLLMLAALWWAEGERSGRRLALYAVLTALWANVHGSFLFAPLLALLYSLSRFLRPLVWKLDRAPEWRAARYYLAAASLSAAASLVNPYGWRLHQHVIGYLADSELLASVGEFQSFNFHGAGAWQILAALAVAAAGTAVGLARHRLDHFLLGLILMAWALRSARGLPLVALLLLPIAGGHLSKFWSRGSESGRLQPALSLWLRRSRDYGRRLRDLDRGGSAWLCAPLLLATVAFSAPLIARRAGFPESDFPVAASAHLERLAPELFESSGRLLAPDKFGGYLIYRFQGRLKVFFDGRSDFYGREFLKDYRRLVQVRPGWEDQVKQFGFTHALLPNDYSLVDALQRLGWTVKYRDETATLLAQTEGT